MAARVEGADVKEILQTKLTASVLTPFITLANQLVNRHLKGEASLTEDELKEIERWLAAHLVAIRTPPTESESTGGQVTLKFQGKSGMGLKATTYGQQVIAMDPTGKLANLDNNKRNALRFRVGSAETMK